jgi:hypothetical protein
MSNTVKIMLVAVAIIAIAGFGYWYSTGGTQSASGSSTLATSTPTGASATGSAALNAGDVALNDKFLSLLLNMRTIKLDQSIFTSQTYLSLRDFSTPIAPDPNPGRVNPFAPIGIDAANAPAYTVITAVPSSVTKSTAVFAGVVPTGVAISKAYFEYGTTSTTPLSNVTAGVTPATTGTFTFPITGLTANTNYFVRAAAIINGTVVYGAVQPFQTLAR